MEVGNLIRWNPVGSSSLEKRRQSGNSSLHFSTTAWVTGIYEMPEYMHGERSDLKKIRLVWKSGEKDA